VRAWTGEGSGNMMKLVNLFLEVFVHLDRNLAVLVQSYGALIYPLLFLIIFAETGLVVTPFLPGDSLLFAAGALAAIGSMKVSLLFVVITCAAILGDNVNYWIGYHLGPKVFTGRHRFFKVEYLIKTQEFYEKHGPKTVILARFFPIIRTFAPFVAGIGRMRYSRYLLYDVSGGVFWVALFLFAGYFLGSVPFIKKNFSVFILLIIFVSLAPLVVRVLQHKLGKGRRKGTGDGEPG